MLWDKSSGTCTMALLLEWVRWLRFDVLLASSALVRTSMEDVEVCVLRLSPYVLLLVEELPQAGCEDDMVKGSLSATAVILFRRILSDIGYGRCLDDDQTSR